MSSEIRTFKIRDAAVHEDELALGEFLRTVDVARIETTYAGDAWHILVMFEELRKREETAQIQSAIVAALNHWRALRRRPPTISSARPSCQVPPCRRSRATLRRRR
jgi:hypothetical protein